MHVVPALRPGGMELALSRVVNALVARVTRRMEATGSLVARPNRSSTLKNRPGQAPVWFRARRPVGPGTSARWARPGDGPPRRPRR